MANSNLPRIGIDLMGGDIPPWVLFDKLSPLIHSLEQKFIAVLLGTEEVLHRCKEQIDGLDCIDVIQAKDFISNNDPPLPALRQRPEASTLVAMRHIKERSIDALVSLGNTGALLSAARLYLPALEKIKRPALLALVPTISSPVAVIDVGGSVQCSSRHLRQFALMGVAYQKSRGITNPRVGLLNIGSEKLKGRKELIETHRILEQCWPLNGEQGAIFVGNIEGRDVFSGKVDVLVTDGFTGNVFLKSSEGASLLVMEKLKTYCPDTLPSWIETLRFDLDYQQYPGAVMCGVDGIIIKCHGASQEQGILKGILAALDLHQTQFIDKIKRELGS